MNKLKSIFVAIGSCLTMGASIMSTPAIAEEVALALQPAGPDVAGGIEPSGEETIEGEAESFNRMTVPVTIGGVGPFDFMIDTGAQATVVTRGISKQSELEPAGKATLVGMASREVVDLVDIDQLMLGTRSLSNILAPVLEKRNVGADGIIGIDSLQGLRVLIDFRDNTITVADAKELGGNKGFEIVVRARRRDGQLLITDADIEGVRTAVVIDTGAQMSLGNHALRRRLRARLTSTSTSTDVLGNKLTGDVGIVRSLKIDGLRIDNLAVSYADTPAFDALGLNSRPALSLGMYHLRMFDRVAIDFDTRKVLFDLPSGSRRRSLSDLFRQSR